MEASKTLLYAVTFAGLYLELAGAFLLSIEAIGKDRLLHAAQLMRNHRLGSFSALVVLLAVIILLYKQGMIIHMPEAMILIITLGLLNDFAPRMMERAAARDSKGLHGLIGFGLFAAGFTLQAYVTLASLY